jgi:hypothetical protein
MRIFVIAFLLVLIAYFVTGIVTPIPRRLLAPAYKQRTGKDLPEGIVGVIDDENHPAVRTKRFNQHSRTEMERIATDLCGRNSPPIYYSDMITRFSHLVWETNKPSTYVLRVYLPDPNGPGPLGGPLLTARGDFNSSRLCRDVQGCGLRNDRSSTFDGDNVTTFGSAFFWLSENRGEHPVQEMCGYDSAIMNSGTFGDAVNPGNGGTESSSYVYALFRNLRSRMAQVTLDIFSTAGFGSNIPGDAGVGTNDYRLATVVHEGETVKTMIINSTFNMKDPITGDTVIYAFQDTTWNLDA